MRSNCVLLYPMFGNAANRLKNILWTFCRHKATNCCRGGDSRRPTFFFQLWWRNCLGISYVVLPYTLSRTTSIARHLTDNHPNSNGRFFFNWNGRNSNLRLHLFHHLRIYDGVWDSQRLRERVRPHDVSHTMMTSWMCVRVCVYSVCRGKLLCRISHFHPVIRFIVVASLWNF